jgi:hypothetical protein
MLWLAKQLPPDVFDRLTKNPSLASAILEEAAGEDLPDVLQLDKAWNGIHWLLALDQGPTDAPESRLIYGGTEIGEDVAYGPGRYLTALEVRAAADGLAKFPRDVFVKRYNPGEMDDASVYPGGWADRPREGLDWLLEGYDRLVPYVRDAAAKGNALVTFVF